MATIKEKFAESFADAMRQAQGEADLAFEKLEHFDTLVADAEAYEAWEGTIDELKRQREWVKADWLRRKKIAELCAYGYKAKFADSDD